MKREDTTVTARRVRRALKEAFPGVKFSVQSKKYSMGTSIHVSWKDGPTESMVEKVAKVFQGGYFDGMTDYKGSRVHKVDGEEIHFGADFIFCNRHLSADLLQDIVDAIWSRLTHLGRIQRGYTMPEVVYNGGIGAYLNGDPQLDGEFLGTLVHREQQKWCVGKYPGVSAEANAVELVRSY